MIKNDTNVLNKTTPSGLRSVETDAEHSPNSNPATPPKTELDTGRFRIVADLRSEFANHGFDPTAVLSDIRLLMPRLFLFPKISAHDTEPDYVKRVRQRLVVFRVIVAFILAFMLLAFASIFYSTNELVLKPRKTQEHRNLLEQEFAEIIANTELAIDPVNPAVPDWLWSTFSPKWYIEEAVYTRSLDLSDHNVELLSFLREKKAIIAREIEPAYSNDKIQNRLRDPDIIYFGSDYKRAYRRFVNAILTVVAIAHEDNKTPGMDTIYNPKRRAELIARTTTPKPPEPNAYYDSRIAALLTGLIHEPVLLGNDTAIVNAQTADTEKFVSMLDGLYKEKGHDAFLELSDTGLGPILRSLPYGWGSTDLTRLFYESKRKRFVNWNVLELRLLMLDLIYGAAKLPQKLPLVDLYMLHLGGEGYQKLYSSFTNKELLAEAIGWVAADSTADNSPANREQRFIDAFMDSESLAIETENQSERRVALSLLLKAARFEHTYENITATEDELAARPYLGSLGLPVNSIEPNDIRPWGLYKARRNGYAHEGLDVGGELGEPVLAVMDGTIIRGGYQRRGAGNYLVLQQGNIEVTYMHLLREPSRSNFKRLLTRDQIKEIGNDSRKGYQLALRNYASIILGKSSDSLKPEELDPIYIRDHSRFETLLNSIRKGSKPKVRKGGQIANIGLSGNVTLNSSSPEMIYPHVHLEINDGRIDPMQVIQGIGAKWFKIRDHHLNHPFYRNWLKQSHNWSWYSKFYPSGAVPDDKTS